MSQEDDFPDEPLPEDPPVAQAEAEVIFERSQTTDVSTAITALEGSSEPLAAAERESLSSYGRNDPASLAAVQSTELAAPDLHTQDQPELAHAAQGSAPVAATQHPAEVEKSGTIQPDLSNWDPHLAHMAQVGLTSADHWEEQVKPRIDQLHDDINVVNMQLDNLVKAKPKYKHS